MSTSAWMPPAASGEASDMLRRTCSRETWVGILARFCEAIASSSWSSPARSSSSSPPISSSTPAGTPRSPAVRAQKPCGSGSRSIRGTTVSQKSASVSRWLSDRLMVSSPPGARRRLTLAHQRCTLACAMEGDPSDPHTPPNADFPPEIPEQARQTADATNNVRLAISNALVRVKKELYGKGPVKAKTYLNDNYVFSVLEGGLTRNEETLLEAGEHRLVRDYRLRFQEAVAGTFTTAVEEATGRRVLSYHSQIVFEPERAFEIFVLDGPPEQR